MHLRYRLAIGVVCLLILSGICVHYGSANDENWPHPTGDQLQKQGPGAFVGERILLFGEVRSVDDDADVITIHVLDDSNDVAAELEVHGFELRVEPGGVVQVYGVLESEAVIEADQTVVVNRDPSTTAYKLGTSLVGLLLAVGYFLRTWHVNVRELAFEPRASVPERNAEYEEGPRSG
ncbi:DNA-binding protein [Natrinema halophilum]|uniref:DNA-binding protein n=1 Tax=Natrinema halophilum TaxID=1699371 RepID=A0A7D5GHB0_9EURY|nr:DNA-binding protein [Natrinema halophilum]QLG48927.1 DNA-binding protein [Natrinema halophilum]